MSVERKLIIGDAQNEQVAVVTIVVPAGGEIELERTWRFLGWQLKKKPWIGGVLLKVEEPNRVHLYDDSDDT
jgi:hypothetical protein